MSKSESKFEVLAARYIMGECKTVDFAGPKERVECIVEALRESRRLYIALEDESVSLAEVLKIVASKNNAAQKFKKVTGRNWHF